MVEELVIAGMSVSPKVFDTIVRVAAEGVEGVACVGVPTVSSNSLFSFLSSTARVPQAASVGARMNGDDLQVAVRLTAFFGYPFLKLADDVRAAVAESVEGLVGVRPSSVDVFIDAIVFPKE